MSRPFPYQHRTLNSLHQGVVAITGTGEIDLGIGHNNFTCAPSIKGGTTEAALGTVVMWTYGSRPGTIAFTIYKRPDSYGAWVVETVARNVGFIVTDNGPVGA